MLFATLASYLQKLEATPSRNEITKILSELFAHAKADEIGKLSYLLQGRVAPLYEAVEFGVADKFIIRAVAKAFSVDLDVVQKHVKRLGDIGTAAEVLHNGSGGKLTVVDVYNLLRTLAESAGQGSQDKKIQILADLFSDLDSLSVRYVARIPLDKLRLGFSETTMLDAMSVLLAGDKSLRVDLEAAFNVRPDIGFITETIKRDGMKGLTHVKAKVGSPVLSQLAQRLPNADDMIKKMGEVSVEPKYDGVRVQLHFKRGSWVRTFSRNMENTTEMFPELSEVGHEIHADDVILDGEAVAIDPKTGKLLSFQETTKRKRKHDIAETVKNIPLKFFIFDMLYKNGKDLLSVPLVERRAALEKTIKPIKLLAISPLITTNSAEEVRRYHDEQLKNGLEGALVKKWNSPYEPGRRGYSWVKFKEEEGKTGKLTDTIDAVVMGYYLGEGKRSDFGIGAFLVGVRSGDNFVTVTKIGTGVSDELWIDLRKHFHKIQERTQPKEYGVVNKIFIPDVWIAPKIVVEIAGDDLTKSPTHGAGFAVRFPRLVKIRTDKSPAQATTVKEVEKMYSLQASKN